MQVRAWLIQSVTGYLAELDPHFTRILQEQQIADRNDFVLWLVRRELREVYWLYEHREMLYFGAPSHYEATYQRISKALPFEMQCCFTHYFKAPRLHDSAAIEVQLRAGSVICIGYLTNLIKYHPRT